MKNLLLIGVALLNGVMFAQEPFENNKTYTYQQLDDTYRQLAKDHPGMAKLIRFGTSDHGEYISLFLINKQGKFQEGAFQDQAVLLINNAIHPGEPCGVDASVKLAKDLLADPKKLPENVVIGIIPMYNVGGGQNRNCCSRANQNGPEEYGFRGNAKNLDLNRDFIKADSRNTRVFYKIYRFLDPHIFIDTHTSNGADYQHIMTLITSQTDKMHPYLNAYTKDELNPYLYSQMDTAGYDMVPYVHSLKRTPDDGIIDYLDLPRYSTGFTNLFNTISYVTETHMLKTFEERVLATYAFLDITINYMDEHHEELKALKQKADYNTGFMEYLPINWKLDTSTYEMIAFQGYEATYEKSEVTGLDRLKYDHNKPFTKQIKYYNHYSTTDSVLRPEYYVIPQAWMDVVIRLQMAGVEVLKLTDNQVIDCEVYYIDDYKTGNFPYEGHYLHRDISVTKEKKQMTFYKGDYVIPTRNENAQFIVQTLEPHAPDSYFAWNYFDAILQQKEWFSAYVFEDSAMEILRENPDLQRAFIDKRKTDKAFAEDGFAQLYYIYKHSDAYERSHNLYPIGRFMDEFMNDQLEDAPIIRY